MNTLQQTSNDADKCPHKFTAVRDISEETRHIIVAGEDSSKTVTYQEIYCLVCGKGLGIPKDMEDENGN
jgi:hypothetical protein